MDVIILDISNLLPLGDVWGSAIGFVAIMIFAVGAIGIGARSLSIGAAGGFTLFVYYAITAELAILQPLVFVTLVLIIVGVGFKIWRAEGVGGRI